MALLALAVAFLATGCSASNDTDRLELLQRRGAQSPEPWQQELHNFKDIEYEAEIKVGKQTLRAIFDTGSFEMIVLSTRCHTSECSDHPRAYDPPSNSGFKDMQWKKTFSFGSGWVKCRFSEDTVTVGPFKPIRQAFWQIRDSQMRILDDKSFEMILGLGNPTQRLTETHKFIKEDEKLMEKDCSGERCPEWLSKQYKSDKKYLNILQDHPPLLQNMGSRFFSVCLQPEKGAAGYWTWHERDPKQFGRVFQSMRVTGVIEWKTDLDQVLMRGGAQSMMPTRLGCGGGMKCAVLFDTGTSLITAPRAHVNRLDEELTKLGGSCANITKMPSIVLQIDGQDIILPPAAYIANVTGKEHMPHALRSLFPQMFGDFFGGWNSKPRKKHECQLALMASDAKSEEGYPLWLLGLPFFRHYFATFDVGNAPDYLDRRISVAASDGNCNHPSSTKYMEFAKEFPTVRELDISRIRVPNWIVEHANQRAVDEEDAEDLGA